MRRKTTVTVLLASVLLFSAILMVATHVLGVQETYLSSGIAAIAGLIGGFLTYILQKRVSVATRNLIRDMMVTFAFFGFITLLVGFPFFITFLSNTPLDTYVEPEYMSGILAASSILFGLWAVATEGFEKLRSAPEFARARVRFGLTLLIINLAIFLIGVLSVFFSVIDLVSSLVSFMVLISSFNINCFLLVFYMTQGYVFSKPARAW